MMKMNKKVLIVLGIIALGIIASLVIADSFSHSSSPAQITLTTPSQQPSSTSSGTTTQQTTSQNPEDIVPGLYPNPIKNNATKQGFKITSLMVENNTDASGNPVSDHLQLTLQNLTNTDLSNFEVYYTITDPTTNKKEGYAKSLDSYVLKAGATQTINFDNKQGVGHFTTNAHSLYFTSSDSLNFNVMVSTPGYKVETASVTKAAGGSEVQGQ